MDEKIVKVLHIIFQIVWRWKYRLKLMMMGMLLNVNIFDRARAKPYIIFFFFSEYFLFFLFTVHFLVRKEKERKNTEDIMGMVMMTLILCHVPSVSLRSVRDLFPPVVMFTPSFAMFPYYPSWNFHSVQENIYEKWNGNKNFFQLCLCC